MESAKCHRPCRFLLENNELVYFRKREQVHDELASMFYSLFFFFSFFF
jgi:hypothetical protein